METKEVSWRQFKDLIEEHIIDKRGPRMCRGQSDSSWKLKTSFHRNTKGLNFKTYFEIVPFMADWIGSIQSRNIDTLDPEVMGSFLATLQHNGYPTPLLDWTLSPYIAAYFAFSEVNEDAPKSDHVAIYVFDHNSWIQKWAPIYDYHVEDSHVTVLLPKAMANLRQIQQQGLLYMFTNIDDIETHIGLLEKGAKETYLQKYLFSVKERPLAMNDLEVMGINAFSLFGGPEGICRYFRESVFRVDKIGQTPAERMGEFLKRMSEKSEVKS